MILGVKLLRFLEPRLDEIVKSVPGKFENKLSLHFSKQHKFVNSKLAIAWLNLNYKSARTYTLLIRNESTSLKL